MLGNRFLKFSFWAFVLGGLVLFFSNPAWFPDFYDTKYFGVSALLYALVIILPALVWRIDNKTEKSIANKKTKALARLQSALAVALWLGVIGSLGLFRLYKFGFEYDKLAHFLSSSVISIALIYFLFNWYELRFKESVFFGVILVVAGGFLWEFIEFSSDFLFNTNSFGIYGEDIFRDSLWDIISDILGAVFGAGFLILRRRKKS